MDEGTTFLSNGYEKKNKKEINFSYKDREAFKIIELEVGTKWEKIQDQFKKLEVFFATLPKMQKKISFTCECGYTEKITLEGLSSFFG